MYPLLVSLLPRDVKAKYRKPSNATLATTKGSVTSETLNRDKRDRRFKELYIGA
jgi:hypothetical protein